MVQARAYVCVAIQIKLLLFTFLTVQPQQNWRAKTNKYRVTMANQILFILFDYTNETIWRNAIGGEKNTTTTPVRATTNVFQW